MPLAHKAGGIFLFAGDRLHRANGLLTAKAVHTPRKNCGKPIMDEISKLVFGCVALVGLVVMIIPNSDPLASKNADAAANGAVPPPPLVAETPVVPPSPIAGASGDVGTGAGTGGFAVEDYSVGTFGQPMVDPTPPGQRNAVQTAAPQQQPAPNPNSFSFQPAPSTVQSAPSGVQAPVAITPPPPPTARENG
jgi:hypothetical protein